MKLKNIQLGLTMFLCVATIDTCMAQVVTNGQVSVEYTNPGPPNGGSLNLTTSGTDQAFSGWFWYRFSGQTQETPFPAPSTSQVIGNRLLYIFNNLGGQNVTAAFQLEIDTLPAGVLPTDFSIRMQTVFTNNNPTPVTLSMFWYYDLELMGTVAADSAWMSMPPGEMSIKEQGTTFICRWRVENPTGSQTLPYSALQTALNDGAITVLNNTYYTGFADFTGAFQKDITIQPNQKLVIPSKLFTVELNLNPPPPVGSVPTASQWTLIFLGLLLANLTIALLSIKATTSQNVAQLVLNISQAITTQSLSKALKLTIAAGFAFLVLVVLCKVAGFAISITDFTGTLFSLPLAAYLFVQIFPNQD